MGFGRGEEVSVPLLQGVEPECCPIGGLRSGLGALTNFLSNREPVLLSLSCPQSPRLFYKVALTLPVQSVGLNRSLIFFLLSPITALPLDQVESLC